MTERSGRGNFGGHLAVKDAISCAARGAPGFEDARAFWKAIADPPIAVVETMPSPRMPERTQTPGSSLGVPYCPMKHARTGFGKPLPPDGRGLLKSAGCSHRPPFTWFAPSVGMTGGPLSFLVHRAKSLTSA